MKKTESETKSDDPYEYNETTDEDENNINKKCRKLENNINQSSTLSNQPEEIIQKKTKRGRKKKVEVVDAERVYVNNIVNNLSKFKIPRETECNHVYKLNSQQTRSCDEIESIMYVCVLCGQYKDYNR